MAAIDFDRPWLLAAMVLAAAPVLLAAWGTRRGRHAGAMSVALQTLALLGACAALGGPRAFGHAARKPLLALQDASASVRGQAALTLQATASVQEYEFARGIWRRGAAPADPSQRAATNGRDALTLAAARAGELDGVILRTDGRFTDTGWTAAAETLGRSRLRVAIVPMDAAPTDARIAAFEARRDGPAGRVQLLVTAASTGAQRRTLTVWRQDRPDQPLLARVLDLLADDSATVRIDDQVATADTVLYRAELRDADGRPGGDDLPENDSAQAIVLSESRAACVLAAPGTLLPPDLQAALGVRCLPLKPADAPDRFEGYLPFAAVLLADPSGQLLSEPQRLALARYLTAGGGLVLIGAGPHGSPADRDDPLNRLLPLVANPYERKAMRVVVVLDSSGSMGRPPAAVKGRAAQAKFDLASQAVLALRSHLTPKDSLAVVVFADRPRTIYDSRSAPPDFAQLRQSLAAVRPVGNTKVLPALEQALSLAAAPPAPTLVVLVSDLLTERFDATAPADKFRRAAVHLGVVAISSASQAQTQAQAPLETLAADLGAPLVRDENLLALADIFTRFLRDARGEPIRGGNFQPAVEGEALGEKSLPPVGAYVLSAAQDQAQVLARVESEPLLATRQAGLGRTLVLAMPLTADNPAWTAWPRLGALLRAAAGAVFRPGDDSRFHAELLPSAGRQVMLRVLARDEGGPMNLLDLVATVQPLGAEPLAVEPLAGRQTQLGIPQTRPGTYELLLTPPAGAAAVEVALSSGAVVWRGVMAEHYPPEFAATGADWPALRRLAELTGGSILTAAQAADIGPKWQAQAAIPVWHWFLAAALALMLCDWALTRVLQKR